MSSNQMPKETEPPSDNDQKKTITFKLIEYGNLENVFKYS